ncbi:baseplate protein (plasmid) [Enterobacter sp. JBIWA008]|uniref:baseplate protein n=1 Tax=Enterobacter sp. JBIWA008 TaxID=2831892 RepID=UPI001CC0A64A|nr:baseplate protein [Enterobacter sp. JBIWA008]UAN43404.1 baseplate protein [Enterobacter sp. JBIWA008]
MKRRAVIVGTKHPGGLMRAQVRVLPDWNGVDEIDLPWAEYQLPIGNAFVPTLAGDAVWVEFPYTDANGQMDTRRPLIVGAAQDAPGGVPNVAAEASGQGTPWTPEEIEGSPSRPALSSTEDFVIHRNNILELRSAGGGYEIANTAAGSRIGMSEDGVPYIIGPAGLFIHVGGDAKVVAGGNVDIEAGGDLNFKVKGVFSALAKSFSFKKA